MKRSWTWILALAPCLMGCWATTTRVEPVSDEHVRFDTGPAQPHLRITEVSTRPDEGGVTMIVTRQHMCVAEEVRRTRQRVHTEVEASPMRWVPAGVLAGVALASVVHYETGEADDDDGEGRGGVLLSSAVLLGTAAAFVAIPSLAERDRTTEGEPRTRTIAAPERPCGQGFVPHARIAVRTLRGTLEGTTGPEGTVRFDGLKQDEIRAVFVEGVAVAR